MEKSTYTSDDFIDEEMTAANTMHHDELLFSYKGILYLTTVCYPETLKALESFEVRRDDVILAGYPKSGINWLSQILTDLIAISQKKTPGREGSVNAEERKVLPYLEIGDLEKYKFFKRMTKLPSPRFLVTHLCPENLAKSIFKTTAKWLGDAILNTFLNGTNMLTKKIFYEEVKENPVLSVKNIATFFGIPLNEEQLQLVVERSSFQSMEKNSDKTHGSFGNILFRKGGVSDWKNLFTGDQNEKREKAI